MSHDRPGRTGNADVDRLLDDFGAVSQHYEKIYGELADLRGHGEAADGLVRVEVAPGGALLGVDIDPRAMRLGSAALAEAIMDASAAATERATARMTEVLEPVIGRASGFSESLQGRLPRMDVDSSITSDPRVSEALRSLQELRDRYGS
jgi:DNA-binding protein YbaB